MSTTNTPREAFLRTVNLVRPALSKQDYVPALKHIKFAGGFATAYDDVTAIVVRCDLSIERCVPGEMLSKTLAAFGGADVAVQYDSKSGALILSSGRSRIKLPTMPAEGFPFDVPTEQAPEVTLTPDVLAGIERCLLSVGNDKTHPAQMGVTLDPTGGVASLYSTDNYALSRYATSAAIEMPGGTPVILPTFFCEQLLALAKAHPTASPVLVFLPGALLVDFVGRESGNAEASLFSRHLVDVGPIDFPAIFAKNFESRTPMGKIPEGFDSAIERALLTQGNELVKTTRLESTESVLLIHSTSSLGESDDDVRMGDDLPKGVKACKVDPALVARALPKCTRMGFGARVLALGSEDGKFTHLVAHVSV